MSSKRNNESPQSATSKPSANSSFSTSPSTNSIQSIPSDFALARASSSKRGVRSTPSTRPYGPTLRAASSADAPLPQQRSITRSPSRTPALATSCSPNDCQNASSG